MKLLSLIYCLVGLTLVCGGQKPAGKEVVWFKNDICFHNQKPREIFKIMQSPPTLNQITMDELKIQIQDVLKDLNILQYGKGLLAFSIYFMTDNSRCICKIETDNQEVNQEKLRQLFENQTLFLDFLPGRQLDVPKDAEGNIILKINNGKIKSVRFVNLELE